jgi:MarR family transcriptional regulator, repressor for mepA
MTDEPAEQPARELDPRMRVSFLMGVVGLKTRARAERFMRELGLTPAQGRTIGYIEANQDRGVIQRELVEMSGTTAASVSSLLDGLEERGYIERRPAPDDARRKLLYVLPKAKGLTDGWEQHGVDTERELLAPLNDEERATFTELLQRINDHFDPGAFDWRDRRPTASN